MKKICFIAVAVLFTTVASAQIENPVHWSYSAKKINATTFEVHLTAEIEGKWHMYSQTTPDGGPIPTSITFTKNPLLVIDGKPKEAGKLEQRHEPMFGVDVKQFGGSVDFVQVVKLKSAIKTNLSGTVEFMVCNDKQCLPPSSQNFTIALK